MIFLIECLKKEIKQYIEWVKIGDSTIQKRYDFFLNQEKKIKKEIEKLNKTLKIVQYKCWYYKKAKELKSVQKLEGNKDKITPKDIRILFDDAHENN